MQENIDLALVRVPVELSSICKDIFYEKSVYACVVSQSIDADKSVKLLFTERAKDQSPSVIANLRIAVERKGFNVDDEVVVGSNTIFSVMNKEDDRVNQDASQSDTTPYALSDELNEFKNVIKTALRHGASDIHFLTHADHSTVEYRVNKVVVPKLSTIYETEVLKKVVNAALQESDDLRGTLYENKNVDVTLRDFKVDDGQGNIEFVSLRVGRTGSQHGTHAVVRVLREKEIKSLKELEIDDDVREMLEHAARQEKGIILSVAPTSHGKSSTIAALVNAIRDGRMIQLLSDPIEVTFNHGLIVQKNVFPDSDELNYHELLRAALRQDPDIVGITEMRDKTVMEKVIGSALTGHLMLSTLHSSDPFDALLRLIEEGINPSLLAEDGLIQCIESQRLIPTLCKHCSTVTSQSYVDVDLKERNSEGCSRCLGGAVGLTVVAESFVPDRKAREFIRKSDIQGLREYAKTQGYVPMRKRVMHHLKQQLVGLDDVTNALGNPFVSDGEKVYTGPSYLRSSGVKKVSVREKEIIDV